MKRLAALFLVLICNSIIAQGLATAPPPNSVQTPYAAERENTIAPAVQAMQAGDYANALAMLEAVMPQYPHDARILMLAGRSAHLSSDDGKALGFYKTALESEPKGHPQWQLHVEIVPLYAAAADWDNFDRERAKIREAVTAGVPYFAKFSGYLIETIHDGDRTIQVTEYPRLVGRFHTRYRFLLLATAGQPWKPYVDCESDDIDQVAFAKEHPDKVANGDRSFSLDGYPAPNMHSTIRLFGDGEPTYETVRALVVGKAAPMSTTVRQ
jgi:hypothetical protein